MTLTKKEQNYQKRLNELTNVAEEIISMYGIDGLTFEMMADKTGYSRSTIFNVFESKNGLITHLALKTYSFWIKQTQKAITYNGSTREKLVSFYIAKVITCAMYPSGIKAILFINNPFFEISLEQKQQVMSMQTNLIKLLESLIVQALNNKDILLADEYTAYDIAEMLFIMNYGSLAIDASNKKLNAKNQSSHRVESYIRTILDKLSWRPNSSEINYKTLIADISSELFNLEMAQLGKNKPALV